MFVIKAAHRGGTFKIKSVLFTYVLNCGGWPMFLFSSVNLMKTQ